MEVQVEMPLLLRDEIEVEHFPRIHVVCAYDELIDEVEYQIHSRIDLIE